MYISGYFHYNVPTISRSLHCPQEFWEEGRNHFAQKGSGTQNISEDCMGRIMNIVSLYRTVHSCVMIEHLWFFTKQIIQCTVWHHHVIIIEYLRGSQLHFHRCHFAKNRVLLRKKTKSLGIAWTLHRWGGHFLYLKEKLETLAQASPTIVMFCVKASIVWKIQLYCCVSDRIGLQWFQFPKSFALFLSPSRVFQRYGIGIYNNNLKTAPVTTTTWKQWF